LGLLLFWFLGFLVRDIESAPGPDLSPIRDRFVDPSLLTQQAELTRQSAELDRSLSNKRAEQQLAGDASENLQRTINQLVELQRLSLQKEVAMTDADRANLGTSLNRFMESQRLYQDLNAELLRLTGQKQQLEQQRQALDTRIQESLKPAYAEQGRLLDRHRLRLALWQLAMLVPLLLVAGLLLVRKRSSAYFPIFLAFGGATLVKAGLVIHKYFPSRYLKYVLIAAVIGVVLRLLVHLIRSNRTPQPEVLLKQYREAYERFLCPVCDYPVRTGPRRYLFWTRRTVNKMLPQGGGPEPHAPFTCPCCGSALFEACSNCQKIRHALLPYCEHCGAAKQLAAG
jgi:hypothetical protein